MEDLTKKTLAVSRALIDDEEKKNNNGTREEEVLHAKRGGVLRGWRRDVGRDSLR